MLLCTIYAPSSNGTVNNRTVYEVDDSKVKSLDNNALSNAMVPRENSKNCAIHNGAKMSDGTANGTVNSDALGKINVLLNLIKANPGCRANALAKMLGKGLRTVKRYIAALVLLKQIEFRGAPKNGGYYYIPGKE